jgi:hypothetical protein
MPVLARVYHTPPPLQRHLTLAEFNDLRADYARLQQQEVI